MKAILISINPKYVAKILNGEKTLEIRKTLPKCDLPIDVYIYCTKDRKYVNLINRGGFLTGMVVAKFTLNKVEEIKQRIGVFWVWGGHPYYTDNVSEENLLKRSCLSAEELENYLQGKVGYAWHIDNLVVFNKPKEIGEFRTHKTYDLKDLHNCHVALTRAPQSWCYVEVI